MHIYGKIVKKSKKRINPNGDVPGERPMGLGVAGPLVLKCAVVPTGGENMGILF